MAGGRIRSGRAPAGETLRLSGVKAETPGARPAAPPTRTIAVRRPAASPAADRTVNDPASPHPPGSRLAVWPD